MNNNKFQIGERVIYVSGRHKDSSSTPKFMGICGIVVGTIIEIYIDHLLTDTITYYLVRWDNGRENKFRAIDLEKWDEKKYAYLFKQAG